MFRSVHYASNFLFQNSFTEVAKLFTEFFRDLDVVPSDIVAGFALLRKHQKLRRKIIVSKVRLFIYFLTFIAHSGIY